MTAALVFLAEAAAACGPAAPARLGGEAEVVRAVLNFEDEAAEMSAPRLAGMSEAPTERPSGESSEAGQPDSDPAAVQCSVVPTVIA